MTYTSNIKIPENEVVEVMALYDLPKHQHLVMLRGSNLEDHHLISLSDLKENFLNMKDENHLTKYAQYLCNTEIKTIYSYIVGQKKLNKMDADKRKLAIQLTLAEYDRLFKTLQGTNPDRIKQLEACHAFLERDELCQVDLIKHNLLFMLLQGKIDDYIEHLEYETIIADHRVKLNQINADTGIKIDSENIPVSQLFRYFDKRTVERFLSHSRIWSVEDYREVKDGPF